MRILLTNDDGVNADGLLTLERIAQQFSDDIWIVAPHTDQSGVAHSLSLHNPLRLNDHGGQRFSVVGTPTDCIIMAVDKLMERKPDLLLSGINSGLNVADGISYSGTVAGAIEGTLQGIKSIALSQGYGGSSENKPDFSISEKIAPDLIRKLINLEVPDGTFFNVNFPGCLIEDLRSVKFTVQGRKNWDSFYIDKRMDNRGEAYYWLAFRGNNTNSDQKSDLKALREGHVSVTPLSVNMTDYQSFEKLANLKS